MINKSLVHLGLVISALVKQAQATLRVSSTLSVNCFC